MVDNIASSIKRKPIASTSVFSRLWGSGVPIFRADADGPSGGPDWQWHHFNIA
jgi:hypothetical protein